MVKKREEHKSDSKVVSGENEARQRRMVVCVGSLWKPRRGRE